MSDIFRREEWVRTLSFPDIRVPVWINKRTHRCWYHEGGDLTGSMYTRSVDDELGGWLPLTGRVHEGKRVVYPTTLCRLLYSFPEV